MNDVAVVIPCFNLGRTLLEAVDSVRAQTRPAGELVIVDDGSDDLYTRTVLARLAAAGTCVARTTNRGVAAARNLGVSLTASPYIVLLDADDVLTPPYVERLAGVLEQQPNLDFVTCGMRAFGNADYTWIPPRSNWVETMARGGPHISTMFRRRLWDALGGFDPELEGYEDQDFWLSALERGFKGDVVAESLLRYRVRTGSRYHRAVERERYVATRMTIHRKHPPPSAGDAMALLLATDAFIESQRKHRTHLEQRRIELETSVSRMRAEQAEVLAQLTSAGLSALDWGDLRRLSPISPVWGLDRGGPLDRAYIDAFLARHQADIQGRVLEVKDTGYTDMFGGHCVTRREVIDIDASNPKATLVADLASGQAIPSDTYDCFILTQTLHIIFDIKAVVANVYRLLKPGGVVLCTVPCVSRINYEDGGLEGGDFWRFTEASARSLFAEVFPIEAVEVTSHGNVLTCAAFLHGVSPDELPPAVLATTDPYFPLICCIRAVKPGGAESLRASQPPAIRAPAPGVPGQAILLYHRLGSRVPDTSDLCVEVDRFTDHMRHLRDAYMPTPLEDLVRGLANGDTPPGAVAITFDDGYLEHLTIAAPILVELGIPATFFVNTESLDQPHECWWDVFDRVMTPDGPLPPVLDLYGDGRWIRATKTPEERKVAHRALVETVFPLSASDRQDLVHRVRTWSNMDLTPRATHRPLLRDEIRQLAQLPGVTIGGHSIHHLSLPLHSPATQFHEILDCKTMLEQTIERPVDTFAYPYGELSGETMRAVAKAGFRVAVTVESRRVSPGVQALLLPRMEIKNIGSAAFGSQLHEAIAPTRG